MRMMALRWCVRAARQRVMKRLFLIMLCGWIRIVARILDGAVGNNNRQPENGLSHFQAAFLCEIACAKNKRLVCACGVVGVGGDLVYPAGGKPCEGGGFYPLGVEV